MAFARLLFRGGKPEFFCFTRVAAAFKDLKITSTEKYLMYQHEPLRLGDGDDPAEIREALLRLG